MYPHYHISITREAIGEFFGARELLAVLAGNVNQDNLHGQIGHPEFHFDDSQFERTYTYIHTLQQEIIQSIQSGDPERYGQALRSLGKLTHVWQDFYAHSNYVELWVAGHRVNPETWDGMIDPLDEGIIGSKDLISGHFYAPWEWITFVPVLGKLVAPLFPKDSHASLNIDGPANSPLFPLAYRAAVNRTRHGLMQLLSPLLADYPENLAGFLGHPVDNKMGV